MSAIITEKAFEYLDAPIKRVGSPFTPVGFNRILEKAILPNTDLIYKAAKELKSRVEDFIGSGAKSINVGTFHSICARILRQEIHNIGYSKNFTIYDTKDQLSLINTIIKTKNINLGSLKPKAILNKISKLKSDMIMPHEFDAKTYIPLEELTSIIYPLYMKHLAKCDALDFDDLLSLPIKLFKKHPEVLQKYQNFYKYILVDEYQDTNKSQFLFIDLLSKKHKNVCVVGDDDQSIYSWRGADVSNILDFEKTYPNSKVFKLEQNYRSTKNIITAAYSVVKNNNIRAEKKLWSDNETGDLIQILEGRDEYDEAYKISAAIQQEIRSAKRNFKDFAILYRTNAQSRVLEQVLNRNKIPNVIVGGVRFYERKEVKDIIAYLSFFANMKDDISLKRIINTPPRGIGNKTLDIIESHADENGISLFDSLSRLNEITLTSRANNVLTKFHEIIVQYSSLLSTINLEEWVRMLIDGLGYFKYLKGSDDEESKQRRANIDELLNAITDYCSTVEQPRLQDYLEEVALMTDIDSWKDKKNSVSLMTLHSAKGLEFPVVLIPGLNTGLLPLGNDDIDEKALNEERRLFYVGITRAEKKLYIAFAHERNVFGQTKSSFESQFLAELPSELVTNQTSEFSSSTNLKSGESTPYKAPAKRSSTSSTTATSSAVSKTKDPKPGMMVSHKIFGTGKIMRVLGHGPNSKLTINFRSAGTKTIIARYVKLF